MVGSRKCSFARWPVKKIASSAAGSLGCRSTTSAGPVVERHTKALGQPPQPKHDDGDHTVQGRRLYLAEGDEDSIEIERGITDADSD